MSSLSYAGLPAAWRGRELLGRADWCSTFADTELNELEACVRAPNGASLDSLGRADLPLPGLSSRLAEVQAALETGSGAVLLRGLPVDRWGVSMVTRAFWALAAHVGTSRSQGADGARLFHVRDHGYPPDDPRFRGPASSARLSFHTDRCDVIAFACLRQARDGGDSFIVSSVSLYEELRAHQPDVLAVLCRPFPYLRHTVDTGNAVPFCWLPVFSEHEGRFAAHLLRVLIDRADRAPDAPSLTGAQRDALDALDILAEDPALHVSLRLEPGDVLLLNNWTTFHRRSAFADVSDPTAGRHLLRIWLSVPNSRPIAPCFSEHFGATGGGALRGGMRPAGGSGDVDAG